MPPRNSRTKAFKKYNHVKSPTSPVIPLDKLYATILNPQKAINNPIYKEFEEYKNKNYSNGINFTDIIDKVIKADDDGDSRYINKQWYKNRAKGYPDDYKDNKNNK